MPTRPFRKPGFPKSITNHNPMKKIRQTLTKIVLLSITILPSAGQSPAIRIWPDEIPGGIRSQGYSERTDTIEEGKIRISRVTDPTIIPYLVPADRATGTAVVICPGGGYGRLAVDHEGYEVAEWLNAHGIAAFVLKYRLPSDAIMEDKSTGPLQDAQEALRMVRRNAKEWNIDPGRVGIMGFSAGGHLASSLSTHYNEPVYVPADQTGARPDFSILVYPVISMQEGTTHGGSRTNLLGKDPSRELVERFSNEKKVDGDTPPAFLVHSADDGAVPVLNSIGYFQALQAAGVPAELHIYQSGGARIRACPGRRNGIGLAGSLPGMAERKRLLTRASRKRLTGICKHRSGGNGHSPGAAPPGRFPYQADLVTIPVTTARAFPSSG